MKASSKKFLVAVGGVVALTALAVGQIDIRSIIKVVGVGAAIQRFGGDINRAINKLGSHRDTAVSTTKVVPILSLGSRGAIGAAQVMGPRDRVNQVKAVAQLDQDLFGKEIKIRAMIPVSSQNIVNNIRRVEGVGISGIVDLKL